MDSHHINCRRVSSRWGVSGVDDRAEPGSGFRNLSLIREYDTEQLNTDADGPGMILYDSQEPGQSD